MYAKNIIFLAAASLIADAVAVNVHRHGHNQVHKNQKKDLVIETEIATVTEWVTVTYDPNAPKSTSNAKFVAASRTRKFSQVASSSPTAAAAETSSVSSSVAEPTPSSSVVIEVPTTLIPQTKPTTEAAQPTTEGAKPDEKVAEKAPTTPVAVPTTTEAPAPPATTEAPASTTASGAPAAAVPASNGANKRVIAYNDPNVVKGFLGSGSKIGSAYNWGQTNDLGVDGINFMPMMWGPGSNHEPTWEANANKAIAAGSKILLSFNEPDNKGQSNLSPEDAAALHIKLMNPFAGKAKISTPAITNSGASNEGVNWLKQWLTACNGQCHFDYVACHWYSDYAPSLYTHIDSVFEAAGVPILLTEFAPLSNINAADFLADALPKLDADSRVAAYAYFMAASGDDNFHMVSGTSPNKIGNAFAFA